MADWLRPWFGAFWLRAFWLRAFSLAIRRGFLLSGEALRVGLAEALRISSETLAPPITDYLRHAPKARLAAVACAAILSSVAGFAATTALLQRPVPVVALEPPAPPVPPKPTWVTLYEIEHARKLGRPLLNISPAELLWLYERQGSEAVDSYRDSWVKIDYPILSFDRQRFDKTSYDVVEASAHFHSAFPGKIVAIFNAQKWDARIALHRAGDQIVAFCRFREIEREEVLTNIHRLWFYGTGCDLPQP